MTRKDLGEAQTMYPRSNFSIFIEFWEKCPKFNSLAPAPWTWCLHALKPLIDHCMFIDDLAKSNLIG